MLTTISRAKVPGIRMLQFVQPHHRVTATKHLQHFYTMHPKHQAERRLGARRPVVYRSPVLPTCKVGVTKVHIKFEANISFHLKLRVFPRHLCWAIISIVYLDFEHYQGNHQGHSLSVSHL